MKGLQYLRRMLVMAAMSLCLTFAAVPTMDVHAAEPVAQSTEAATEEEETFFFMIMGGGLLIILFAVVASVSSVSSFLGVLNLGKEEES